MRTTILFCTLLSVGLLVVCDDQKENVCDQAADITNAAMADACGERVGCLPCECWDAGLTIDGTECGAAVTCDATAATECVANETACASTIYAMVETACASEL